MCVEVPVLARPVCPYLPPPLCALTVGSRVVRLCADISHTHAEIPGNQNDEIVAVEPVRPTRIDGYYWTTSGGLAQFTLRILECENG